MNLRQQWFLALATLICFCAASVAQMQEQPPVVPNLVGMNVPQATAALNRVGLALGNQTSQPWTQGAAVAQNLISTQSVPAGQPSTAGAAIDVTVLRSPNVTLSYDDNDFTLINNTGGGIDFNGLVFGSADGTPAAFSATRWAGSLDSAGCAQVWSVIRSAPKDVAGCARINHWLTTHNAAEYFWTAVNGVNRFKIVQNGVERGDCPAAPAGTAPLTCDLYLPANASSDVTPYLYFAYTTQRLIVFNHSEDAFMPLTDAQIYNNNPNLTPPHQGLRLGDTGLYHLLNPVATVTQLAPGQCTLFTDGSDPTSLATPQPCDVIARFDMAANIAFWTSAFDIDSTTNGHTYSCNGATAGQLTICVMPR